MKHLLLGAVLGAEDALRVAQTTCLALKEVAGGGAGLGRLCKAEVWAAGTGGGGEAGKPAAERQPFKAPAFHS